MLFDYVIGSPDCTEGRSKVTDSYTRPGTDWVPRCSYRSLGWVWNRWPWYVYKKGVMVLWCTLHEPSFTLAPVSQKPTVCLLSTLIC